MIVLHPASFFPRIKLRNMSSSENQRLSVNTHMKETLIHTLEDVARGVVGAIQTETTGIDKLQTIMTEAKEKVLAIHCSGGVNPPFARPLAPKNVSLAPKNVCGVGDRRPVFGSKFDPKTMVEHL